MKVKITEGSKYDKWYYKYIGQVFDVSEKSGFGSTYVVKGHSNAFIFAFHCERVDESESIYTGVIDMSIIERPSIKEAAAAAKETIENALIEFNEATGANISHINVNDLYVKIFIEL